MLDWLIKRRKLKNITQSHIAKKTGITQQAYSAIENGERKPSVQVAKRIGKVLNFDWRLFYPDEDKQTSA